MSKRPSLAEGLRQAATAPEPAAPPPPPALIQPPDTPSSARGFYAASRAGKKKVTASLAPADHKRLRRLALEHDVTSEELLAEAISDLFAKYDQTAAGEGRGAS